METKSQGRFSILDCGMRISDLKTEVAERWINAGIAHGAKGKVLNI